MQEELKLQIATVLGTGITGATPLAGGDISTAYLLQTKMERFFCKVHFADHALSMFLAEKDGLETISRSETLRAPKVVYCGPLEKGACLLLEFIPPGPASSAAMEVLGRKLAAMHLKSSEKFGFSSNNFIGSLPQLNNEHNHWLSFYMQERLLPQLGMARNRGLLSKEEIPDEAVVEAVLGNCFQEISASLLHGDLWSGNYLISAQGEPYLIDPAVYYGHSEVDLAMSRLFGGFDSTFYSAYEEVIPRAPGYEKRQDIYQLYYLLVHLNLFGRSYYSAVSGILRKHFG
ncbi:MAG: fructosamine kinase family protein [Flavobacteriaceae bacterium]